MRKIRMGDIVILRENGSWCPRFEDFARNHNLTKFESGYESERHVNFHLLTPIQGTVIAVDATHFAVDTGPRHVIIAQKSFYTKVSLGINTIMDKVEKLLPEELFIL